MFLYLKKDKQENIRGKNLCTQPCLYESHEDDVTPLVDIVHINVLSDLSDSDRAWTRYFGAVTTHRHTYKKTFCRDGKTKDIHTDGTSCFNKDEEGRHGLNNYKSVVGFYFS